MEDQYAPRTISRRELLKSTASLAALALAAACSPPAPAKPAPPTSSVQAEPAKPAAEPAKPGAEVQSGQQAPAVAKVETPAGVKNVARNRTLIQVRGGTQGKFIAHELWSPYAIGSTPQLGLNAVYEPLAFYSAYADKETLWLAEGYQFSPDYQELTVKTRQNVKWSDGKPFTADDVAYTLNSLNQLGAKVKWGKDVQ